MGTVFGAKFASPFLIVLLAFTCGAQEVSPNDQARYLAGLPVRDTPLASYSLEAAWTDHATEFDTAWKTLDARQLTKIRAWSDEFLAPAASAADPLFYFFSGPDILYAQTFFPSASTYVLCGLEPVGSIPDITKVPRGTLAPALHNLRKALNSVLSFSFFITKDMKADLNQTQLSGTLPVLYVFLARSGSRIDSVELVGLDKTGALTAEKPVTRGAKIVFFGPSGHQQTLYYFTSDLSNDGIKANPAFTKFCDNLGSGQSLVKAASYLMHLDSFHSARDFLLTHSRTLVEDDSGIPLKAFDLQKWNLRLFGAYPGPIPIFKQYYQPDLAQLYKVSNPAPLGFSFGYRWQPRDSSLILATPK
jgi:hypothetical protein